MPNSKINNIEEAIKLAIEGGYREKHIWGIEDNFYILIDDLGQRNGKLSIEQIILDSLFWQALGKVRGWDSKHIGYFPDKECIYFSCKNCQAMKGTASWDRPCPEANDWLPNALHYFETHLSGGSEEEFWQNLP